ncbi:MAG: heat-inducible transcriptional repressor HrcA [Deltaproteobacteria bacterium]|jgi:heat-inducible transcriptional repressor|nr:heat-inducible transcriptional repressor HrcA [Deltaproteobacteria bacterium]
MMTELNNDRQKMILAALVEEFIRTGEPVASATLARPGQFSLSPASVRKVLAELEALGLLRQPHTSAGRTPTEEGFRIYVDDLLDKVFLPERTRSLIQESLAGRDQAESIFSLCSKVLSNLTSQMGLIVAPGAERLWLKRLHFVRLGRKEVLAVLVTENGLIHNRLLNPAEDYTQDQLSEVNVYLEDLKPPFTLAEIRDLGLLAMGRERHEFERLFARVRALVAATSLKEEAEDRDIFLDDEGRGRLLEHPDLAAAETLRALFLAFENKRRLVELLDEITGAGRTQVVFGPSGQKADALALVASPYFSGDKRAGALGVIGPRRLNYSEIVPVVDYAARVVSDLLNGKL